VRLTAWRYRCGYCGADYELADADLAFLYGTFLAHSVSGVVVVIEALSDPSFAEIRNMIDDDPRVASLSSRERVALLHDAFSITLDPDQAGNAFVLVGSPGCPRCGSRSVANFAQTDEPVDIEPRSATHHAWLALSHEQRHRALQYRLDSLLDGA
jgi:hypothetical protein